MKAQLIVSQLGNDAILHHPLTAFLCSRQVPANAVLSCYDWAMAQREAGNVVISGFHSPLEKDVLRYLLKGQQPVVMALARGMKQSWEPPIQKALDEGRLLIITPFPEQVRRASEDTAAVRNDMMMRLAKQIVVGYASSGGMLERRLGLERDSQIVYLV